MKKYLLSTLLLGTAFVGYQYCQVKADSEVKLSDIKDLQSQIDELETRIETLESYHVVEEPTEAEVIETYWDNLVDEYGNQIYDEYGNPVYVEVPIVTETEDETVYLPFVPYQPPQEEVLDGTEQDDMMVDVEEHEEEVEQTPDQPHEELPQETELLPFEGDASQYLQDILSDGKSHEWYTDNDDNDKIYVDGNQLIVDDRYVTFWNINEWYLAQEDTNKK